MKTKARIRKYISEWKKKGYPDDIPDEVPAVLMPKNLAPSYKAIAQCLLSNDMNMEGLGFSAPKSKWYGIFKRIEIEGREK